MIQRKLLVPAAPIVALLLCMHVVACDGSDPKQSSTSGSTGSGEGGSGGNGNTGGNGSGGAGGEFAGPACSMEQAAVGAATWPWFGFEQALPDPKPDLNAGAGATVTAIEQGGLRLTFDGATMDVRLAWAGPDLNQIFTAGDMVTVTTDAGLQAYRVTGAKGQAVILRYANAEVPTMVPAIPGGGPNLALEVECTYEVTKMCPSPERRTLYSLSASLGPGSAKISSGMTGKVGAWQIYHIKSLNSEFFTATDCTPDKFFDGVVQALEVKP